MAKSVGRVGQGRGNAARAVAFLLCISLVAEYASAGEVQVGGGPGWLLGVQYSRWLQSAKIKTKDTLYFKYPPGEHNVVQVSASDYNSCNANNGIQYFRSGTDKFPLSKAGTYYFICGIGDHCKRGMKVAITVKN